MNLAKIISKTLFISFLFCVSCDIPPVDLCSNGILDLENGEIGIDCGGINCEACRQVDTFKEMVIIDTAVVNHPEAKIGRLSFGHLIRNMTTDAVTKEDLILGFLQSWEREQTINNFTVAPRPRINERIIKPWMEADGQAGSPIDEWKINLDNAPFKLLAVVNRLDLLKVKEGRVTNSGEGRFVYCAVDSNNRPLPFTVIFEYQLPILDTTQIFPLVSKWHNLGAHETFDSSYVEALIAVTENFVGKNVMPTKPNGNALNQIRTNEVALSGPWELREFNLDRTEGIFKEVTRKMTPDFSLNGSQLLTKFIQENEEAIRTGQFTIPLVYDGQPFLGGFCPTNSSSFKWNAPGVSRELIDKFSIKTCNGCHGGDTGTPFTHIGPPSTLHEPASVSTFLMGEEMSNRLRLMHEHFLKIQEFNIANKPSSRTVAMPLEKQISIEELIRRRANNVH